MAMSARSSSDAGVSIAAQPHQGRGTRNGRTMCGALMRSQTNAANLCKPLACQCAFTITLFSEADKLQSRLSSAAQAIIAVMTVAK